MPLRKMILHKCVQSSCFIVFPLNLLKIFKCTYTNHGMSTETKFLSESRCILKDIFRCAVKSVSPYEIVRKKVKFHQNTLYINEKSFRLQENVYLVGFGKAVMGMAVELEKMLGNVLKEGIVSVPSLDAVWTLDNLLDFPKLHNSVISYREGSKDNQPDSRALDTTHDIIDLVEKLTETDTLIVLMSGGGSALLYMPRPLLDQEDKLELCRRLHNAGADIAEVNTIRKKLSLVKGGGLARIAYPATIIALILSDFLHDCVETIASGPTVYTPKAPEQSIAILKKYNMFQSLQGDLKTIITSKETFDDSKMLNSMKQFKHVTNMVIGNNMVAIEAASFEAARKKLTPIILRNDIIGNVQNVSLAYVHITSLICLALLNELKKKEFYDKVRTAPIIPLSIDKVNEIFDCIISGNIGGILLIGGGEPTVMVTGKGKGGRNQELALRFSLDWLAKIKSYPRFVEYDVIMLSAGTDGQDGPTDAAGAFGYPAIAPIMQDFFVKVKSMATKEMENEQELTNKTHNLNKMTEESDSIQDDKDRLLLTVMEAERMLPINVLKENDSYNFYSRFKKGADLLKTGLTGTNVMDLHFIYIKKRSCKCEIDAPDKLIDKEEVLNIHNLHDVHDLHIDASTIEKYKALCTSLKCDKDKFLHCQMPFTTTEEKCSFELKVIDENFHDPCCNKKCKVD